MEYKEYQETYARYYPTDVLTTAAGPQTHFECGHVHEFLGSTKLAESGEERHNHRFAGVSGQAIAFQGSHVHQISTNTDFFDHLHRIEIRTGPAINVGHGKHVHLAKGMTTVADDHRHDFIFATLIEAPLV